MNLAFRGSQAMLALNGNILHFLDDPVHDQSSSYRYVNDGYLLIVDGRVHGISATRPDGDWNIVDCTGRLILPGFIDIHTHYPQTDIIASYGEQLLTWLEKYTFPTEARFGDPEVASDTAEFFIGELLRNGVTSAMVFATVHAGSVDALFEAAARRDMCMLTGKVMMDRHAPEMLSDTAQSSYDNSLALIRKWHGRGRARYVVTPRFAVTSSHEQLTAAGELFQNNPGVYLQSHVAENRAEVAWIAELFPAQRSYLDVYDVYRLLGERAVYAHCIYLDEQDRRRLAQSGTAAAFCPTSNLFLGSGLFDLSAARQHGFHVGLGTDVGGGTSFGMLQTMSEGYKVAQLGEHRYSPLDAYYQATLGGARALHLDQDIGSFKPGAFADVVVLDTKATPLLERRMSRAESLEEVLFALMMLGDDRCVEATYVRGQCVHRRAAM